MLDLRVGIHKNVDGRVLFSEKVQSLNSVIKTDCCSRINDFPCQISEQYRICFHKNYSIHPGLLLRKMKLADLKLCFSAWTVAIVLAVMSNYDIVSGLSNISSDIAFFGLHLFLTLATVIFSLK